MRRTRTPYRRSTISMDTLALIVLKSTHSPAIASLLRCSCRRLKLNQFGLPQLNRSRPRWCWNLCQLSEELVEGGHSIVDGSDLLFAQGNGLTEIDAYE